MMRKTAFLHLLQIQTRRKAHGGTAGGLGAAAVDVVLPFLVVGLVAGKPVQKICDRRGNGEEDGSGGDNHPESPADFHVNPSFHETVTGKHPVLSYRKPAGLSTRNGLTAAKRGMRGKSPACPVLAVQLCRDARIMPWPRPQRCGSLRAATFSGRRCFYEESPSRPPDQFS